MRRVFMIASLVLLVTLLLVIWQGTHRPKPIALTPTLSGQVEYCLTCHAELPEISKSHPISTFGCVSCHGGERLALDANLAHSSMRGGKNPSDFAVVVASCGGDQCHSGQVEQQRNHIQRTTTSLQATYAGAIATIRYAFGAQPDLVARMSIYAVSPQPDNTGGLQLALIPFDPTRETSPGILTFAQNCLFCHLSAKPLPGKEYNRLTGCSTCHTPASPAENGMLVHQLSTKLAYTQCNTCHNRGNYNLSDIKFHVRMDQPMDRLHDYYQPIAQFTRCEWTLDCIDCHTRHEVMGDGNLYSNKKEIQYIRCKTCHGTLMGLPLTHTITEADDLALKLAFLNPVIELKVGDTILMSEKGEPLWTIRRLPDGRYEQFSKATGQRFTFSPVMGSSCQQKPDQQEARYCEVCHAAHR